MSLHINTFSGNLSRFNSPSPIGELTIVASERGVRGILWDCRGLASVEQVSWRLNPVIRKAMGQLEEYFQGKRTVFDVELDPVGTDFQKRAWKALLRIPYGEVSTYSQQAHFMGSAKWARAVGGANGRNPVPIFIPCHRVIGKDGSLTGFAGGLKIKSFLLQLELENQDQFYGNEKKYFL